MSRIEFEFGICLPMIVRVLAVYLTSLNFIFSSNKEKGLPYCEYEWRLKCIYKIDDPCLTFGAFNKLYFKNV